jgi:hypothetical protein
MFAHNVFVAAACRVCVKCHKTNGRWAGTPAKADRTWGFQRGDEDIEPDRPGWHAGHDLVGQPVEALEVAALLLGFLGLAVGCAAAWFFLAYRGVVRWLAFVVAAPVFVIVICIVARAASRCW